MKLADNIVRHVRAPQNMKSTNRYSNTSVSYTHLDVYKRQKLSIPTGNFNVLSIKASIKKSAITVNHSIADYFIKYNNCVIGFSFTSY